MAMYTMALKIMPIFLHLFLQRFFSNILKRILGISCHFNHFIMHLYLKGYTHTHINDICLSIIYHPSTHPAVTKSHNTIITPDEVIVIL